MPKTRRALILLGAIAALLAILLVLVPRRPPSGGGASGAVGGGPGPNAEAPGGAGPTGGRERPVAGEPAAEGTAARPEAGRETPYPVPEKEPVPLPAAPAVARSRGPAPPERAARVAIVIDDVGYSLEGLRAFLQLPYPIAFSVLPDLPHSAEAVRLVSAAGRELLVHMPMEPAGGADPGPGAILTSQSDREIEELLAERFARFPAAAGMNNHMGSRATADRRVMGLVLGFLAARGKFFLDSRTSPDTLGASLGKEMGARVLERDVFVDNENTPAYIAQALERGARIARSRGYAVLIGHVQNVELAEELARRIPALERDGIVFVFPGALAAESGDRS